MRIYGAMETPDGEWRVEIIRMPGTKDFWYRVIHGENVIDWLSIAQVDRILSEAGVNLADLVDVSLHAGEGQDSERPANGA